MSLINIGLSLLERILEMILLEKLLNFIGLSSENLVGESTLEIRQDSCARRSLELGSSGPP